MLHDELKILRPGKVFAQRAITAALCFLFFTTLTPQFASADGFTDTGRNSRGYKETGGDIDLTLGISGAGGTMKSSAGTIAARSLMMVTASARFGVRSGFMEPFIYADYGYNQQTTPAIAVANSNLSGLGYLAGGGFGISGRSWMISATYIPYGQYTTTQPTANGQSTSYSNPVGYLFMAEIAIHSGWSISAYYKTVDYSKLTVGGVESDITSDKLSHTATGATLEWSF
jgi:hypothetical protein